MHVWLGLTDASDLGARFDLRVQIYESGRNGGGLLTSGETHCISGLKADPDDARPATVKFAHFDRFKMLAGDSMYVVVFARIGSQELR